MRKAIILTAILCAACSDLSSRLPTFHPYHLDIQQGNVITPKMMMQLRPGMSKAQVKFVMGTPLIADSFHANRWDYFYQMRKDGKVIEQRRVILEFEDEKLKRVRGDVIPATNNGTSASQPEPVKEPVTLKSVNDAPVKKEEKGMLDKLKFWQSDSDKSKPDSASPPAPTPAINNQQLEVAPALAQPAPASPQPAAIQQPTTSAPAEQKPKEKGLLDTLMFWKSDDQPAPPKPQPKVAPVPAAVAPAKIQTDVQETSKPATASQTTAPKAESKPAPSPKEDLPAEEDPSYFERMLEKIGF
jgi:outer membrane protein assembly factor BamE